MHPVKQEDFDYKPNYKPQKSRRSRAQFAIDGHTSKHYQYAQKLPEKVVCVCGRTFIYEAQLKYHKKWECGKILSCDYCGKVFTTKSNQKTHLKICRIVNNDVQ